MVQQDNYVFFHVNLMGTLIYQSVLVNNITRLRRLIYAEVYLTPSQQDV